ncbi:hypothetical protein IF1G_06238 [Cordyceps javanica]|uniref:Uncharacterized protein n=1 Tax=Cordyceps javanica TaxID=43265 RepID=A0A545VV01_9HYPO|nr:hypothetical protein IF1G_06238 [Cordyceps javanica]TQW05551.1 hypothetical protein IF2G_06673 [Cordyceps javanica]
MDEVVHSMLSRDALQYPQPAQMTGPDKRRSRSFNTVKGEEGEGRAQGYIWSDV